MNTTFAAVLSYKCSFIGLCSALTAIAYTNTPLGGLCAACSVVLFVGGFAFAMIARS